MTPDILLKFQIYRILYNPYTFFFSTFFFKVLIFQNSKSSGCLYFIYQLYLLSRIIYGSFSLGPQNQSLTDNICSYYHIHSNPNIIYLIFSF